MRAVLAAGLAGLPLCAPAQAARLMAAHGTAAEGYGRIVLAFDKAVPVKAKVAGNILVLTYGERTTAGPDRLAAEMSDYVSAVRRDPDGSGLRLALQKPVRVNVQTAGEQVFVDLLPEGWTGLPPALPAEVVAELARRAERAEAALRSRAPAPARRALPVEIAHLPTLTRLTLHLPAGARAAVTAEGPATRLRVSGPYSLDLSETRGRGRPALARVAAEEDADSASLLVEPGADYRLSSDRDEDGITLDIVPKAAPKAAAKEALKTAPKAAGAASPAAPPEPPHAAEIAPRTPPRAAEPAGPGTDAAETPERAPGSGLVFAFHARPAAALFERAGSAILAFETGETVAPPAPGGSGLVVQEPPRRVGPLTLLRFAVPDGRPLDLVPVRTAEGPGWELVAGESLGPSEMLTVRRQPDGSGRLGLGVNLARPGSATWIDLDGERLVVVPSLARKAAGSPKVQRFVDFDVLASRRGLAVLARADDLAVRPELAGVSIGRTGGLAVSAGTGPAEPPLVDMGPAAIGGRDWEEARLGDVRGTIREAQAVAAAAAPGSRGAARLALARRLVAAGLDPEGLAALEAAVAEDPALATDRTTAILRALAQVRMGRADEARRGLSGETLARDPEATLWRAVADAEAGRWAAAETGFQRALSATDEYPNDLRLLARTAAAEAALETGDTGGATARLEPEAARGLPPLVRDRQALVRARIAEAQGRTEAALAAYDRLTETGEPPVAAAAALRATLLAQAEGRLPTPEAIERLERLALAWHGGETAEAVNAGLARLNFADGRWRAGFEATRRAYTLHPDSAVTRALHGEAQAAFDALFLDGRGDDLPGIQAVALYFDFKEFAPIGRRGDEAVRRLADRLVELDLVDSAADLLQHQVDHRLTGAARSGVAARLAALRLMDGQPLRALETLDASTQPELPAELRRGRALLRARALSDLTRTDLALETVADLTGPDVERLRADILWTARRWREAGEAHEGLLHALPAGSGPLDDEARADVIRAGIAYGLAGETLGLERLKAKFAAGMAESPDARAFALLTQPDAARQPGFRSLAQRTTSGQTLSAFLAEYRKRFPEGGLPERGAARPTGGETVASAGQPG